MGTEEHFILFMVKVSSYVGDVVVAFLHQMCDDCRSILNNVAWTEPATTDNSAPPLWFIGIRPVHGNVPDVNFYWSDI